MNSDPDLVDAETLSPPSTFVPDSERAAGTRLPAVLGLFVSWVVRDGKRWVGRL